MGKDEPTPGDARSRRDARAARIGWLAALAGLVLLAERVVALLPDLTGLGPGAGVQLLARGLWQDWLGLLVFTYLIVSLLRSERFGTGRALAVLHAGGVAVLLLWGAANLLALDMLGAPVTRDWLAYSDIAHTDVILDSLAELVPLRVVLGLGAALVALWAAARALAAHRRPGAGLLLGLYGLGIVAGLALDAGPGAAGGGAVARARLMNPVWAFVQSLGAAGGDAAAAALAAPEAAGPAGATAGPGAFATVAGLPRPTAPAKPIRNVLLFAYESMPAGMAEGWGGRFPVTPHLKAALPQALAFDRAYAHVPASNYYLVSAFAGLVPELSATSMTEPGRLTGFPSLARVLGAAGLRSAFFNSSDNRFQNTGGFVTEMGFEHVVDYRDWSCADGIFAVDSITDKFRNTSSDLCTADQIAAWIDAAPDRPFFLAFRTGMTHYPYFPGHDPQSYGQDETLDRYLNALRVGDAAFGQIMAHLAARGLAEETLVVVMGDHGEAFGEHGTYVHAAGIYEENVHIPFALINPQLFAGTRSDLLVGLEDLAPTVTDLMGLAAPWQWEGRSIFAAERPDGLLAFAPWNGFQIGFRQGMEKFIYNASTGEARLFDLGADPQERDNRAAADPAAAEAARARLSRAVAAHRDHIGAVLAGAAPARSIEQETEVVLTVSGTRFGAPPKGWVMLDGAHLGGFEVPGAPDTTNAPASPDAIRAALTEVRLPLEAKHCAHELDIWFLNDTWAGEGLSGDTDLVIRSVQIGEAIYFANRFRLLTEHAGLLDGEDFRLWRKGGVAVDLDLPADCLSAALGAN